jgi:site-specific recombinase XerD
MDGAGRHLKEPVRGQFLTMESKVLATFTTKHIKRLLTFKPKGINQARTHTAALLMLDTGLRISELLGLEYENCDFDNLVLKVKGKGGKHRLVTRLAPPHLELELRSLFRDVPHGRCPNVS